MLIGVVHLTGLLFWDLTQLMDLRTDTVQLLNLVKDGVLQPGVFGALQLLTTEHYAGGMLE